MVNPDPELTVETTGDEYRAWIDKILMDAAMAERLKYELNVAYKTIWTLAQREGGQLVFTYGDVIAAPENPKFETETLNEGETLADSLLILRIAE